MGGIYLSSLNNKNSLVGLVVLGNNLHCTVLPLVMYVDIKWNDMEVESNDRINHEKQRQKSIATTIGAQGTLTNQQIVNKYFQSISKKDIRDLLELFDEDAVVYEPFSNITKGLQGKSAIENFLRVAIMANAGLKRTIKFVDESEGKITAIVTFERGDSVTGKFSFTFVTSKDNDGLISNKRIKILKIEFIEN